MDTAAEQTTAASDPKDAVVNARDAFSIAYMEWLIARAAAQSPNINDDEEMARADQRCKAAELGLISTPAPDDLFLFQKWELVDSIMSESHIIGERSFPILTLALASIKADIFHIKHGQA